jgi:DNA polymerase-3 subunit epsilon
VRWQRSSAAWGCSSGCPGVERPVAASWRTARFIVVDVETTGLDPRRDEVISFAAVPVESGRVIAGQAVSGLVRPPAPLSPRSIEIHGLRAQDLAAAPPPGMRWRH